MGTCQLKGIFAPVPTAFDNDGEIAWEHFGRNIERFGETPLDGILVLGSNGEAVALREREKIRLIETARERFPARKPVLAGVGCESLHATLALCREAARCGADAVVVINPAYYRSVVGKPDVMRDYFRQVADASPLPVLIYNMPRNTALNIPAEVISDLSAHGNIVGIKDSGGDIAQIASIIHDSESDFAVFAGSASFLLPTLYLGGCGGTLACANIAPDLCAGILRTFRAGDHEEARRLQMSVLHLNAAVTTAYGVVGLKYALDCLGYYGGPCRSPLPSFLPEAYRSVIRDLLGGARLLPEDARTEGSEEE